MDATVTAEITGTGKPGYDYIDVNTVVYDMSPKATFSDASRVKANNTLTVHSDNSETVTTVFAMNIQHVYNNR